MSPEYERLAGEIEDLMADISEEKGRFGGFFSDQLDFQGRPFESRELVRGFVQEEAWFQFTDRYVSFLDAWSTKRRRWRNLPKVELLEAMISAMRNYYEELRKSNRQRFLTTAGLL